MSAAGRNLLTPAELAQLSRELRAMSQAGVPLPLGLRSVAGSWSPALEAAGERIAGRLEQGASLADVLGGEPGVPAVYRGVLAAGLRCGREEEMLMEFSDVVLSLDNLRSSLRRSLIYPTLIVAAALGLLCVLSQWTYPQFAEIYQDMNAAVPGWLAWVGWEFLPIVALAGAAGVVLAWAVFTRRHGRLAGLSWAPGARRMVRDLRIAHVARLLGLLIRNRVPLDEALTLTSATVESPVWEMQLLDIAQQVRQGIQFQQAARSARQLPTFLSWLIATGEQAGDLREALQQAADYYSERALVRGEILRQLVPALTLLIVGGGATFAYAMLIFGPLASLWSKLAGEM